jgi:hypothetical protein
MASPGIITSQVIQRIIDDPLVIADLSGHNPNVMYELALRHALQKPVVQLIDSHDRIPFDVASNRTITFDISDLDSVEACKDLLAQQIRSVEADPTLVDNPISITVRLQALRDSTDPADQGTGQIISMLQRIQTQLAQLPDLNGSIYGSTFTWPGNLSGSISGEAGSVFFTGPSLGDSRPWYGDASVTPAEAKRASTRNATRKRQGKTKTPNGS